MSKRRFTTGSKITLGDVELACRIREWIEKNEGADADDVARHFDISLRKAVAITDDLLRRGMIAIAED